MPAPPYLCRDLTGATRYREGWRGCLVLQVEYYLSQGISKSPREDGSFPPLRTEWRDATKSDLPTIEYHEERRMGKDPSPPEGVAWVPRPKPSRPIKL